MRKWALVMVVAVAALLIAAAVSPQGGGEEKARPVVMDQKVVPIVSLGGGVRVGAAMVTGPAAYVRLVSVVAQIEARAGSFRIRALVPAAALPGDAPPDKQSMRRVPKVSVKALIDMRI